MNNNERETSSKLVSMEGFGMILQGSKRPPRGIMLLCGLDSLDSIRGNGRFAPLLRRVHASLVLQRLTRDQAQSFFFGFLRGYVSPSVGDATIVDAWTSLSDNVDSHVSIDMLKTYLMRCMSSFANPDNFRDLDDTFIIDAARWPDFRARVCDKKSWTSHMNEHI